MNTDATPFGEIDRADGETDERANPPDSRRDEPEGITPFGEIDRADGETDERANPPDR
jgi:hypothetical protein